MRKMGPDFFSRKLKGHSKIGKKFILASQYNWLRCWLGKSELFLINWNGYE